MFVSAHGLAHRFPGTDTLFVAPRLHDRTGAYGCDLRTVRLRQIHVAVHPGRVERPAEGTVERSGVDRIGWVFQNPYGVPERSALDHVVFPLLAKGERRRDAEPEAMAAMELFDLGYAAGRRFSDLSGARRNG